MHFLLLLLPFTLNNALAQSSGIPLEEWTNRFVSLEKISQENFPAVKFSENPTENDLKRITNKLSLEQGLLKKYTQEVSFLQKNISHEKTKNIKISKELEGVTKTILILKKQLAVQLENSKSFKQNKEISQEKLVQFQSKKQQQVSDYQKKLQQNYFHEANKLPSLQIWEWLFSSETVSQIITKQRQRKLSSEKKNKLLNSARQIEKTLKISRINNLNIFLKNKKQQDSLMKSYQSLRNIFQQKNILYQKNVIKISKLKKALSLVEKNKENALIQVKNLQNAQQVIYDKLVEINILKLEKDAENNLKKEKNIKVENIKKSNNIEASSEKYLQEISNLSSLHNFFRFPLDFPLKVSAAFHSETYQETFDKQHNGVDFFAPQGQPLFAAADGEIVQTHFSGKSYAYIIIKHNEDLFTTYGHLSDISVKVGDLVRRGDLLGKTGGKPGTNGAGDFTTGEHLHWEVFYRGNYLDGADFFSAENDFE
jgi:murein DD-endopeptidase MepM/ murein hydrolase activator NlpD